MDTFPLNIVPSEMKNMRIEIDEFIDLYNEGKAELVDIRVPMETKVWQVNFGLKIPAPELPERLEELPKDKLLVVACPKSDRSNMARTYLASKGFDVRYLAGGLLGLMDRLKGGKAKDLKLP
ncbi:rhodanese-like domain-containing protein [Hydrogenimonas sp. SS33]|uniref:rhodanese-like domain-containing protein n=1 Tax=Hydrogenimonas leucolamina TaxID=2954236 RepID=UPI00336C2EAC